MSVSRLFGVAGIGVTAEPRTPNGRPGAVFRDAGGRVLHTPAKVTGSRRSG